ncbi:MAG: NAD(P)/FAD-dependent oxidoreductase, partial [Leptospiraceae bacterium]|nr:NAD(P)/FAD-dependent oxidoreductase [Leptospiraceae bacterium]
MAYNVKPVIIIVGGGFGGLETAFQLRHRLRDAVHICLISERDAFYYSPGMMGIPFGAREEGLSFPLAPDLKKANISFVRTRVESIDAVEKRVLAHNYQASYDFLVIATGARPVPDELPGLNRYALSLYSDSELRRLRGELDRLQRHNRPQHLAVVIPPGFPCPGPLYQITAMLDAWLRRKKIRDRVTLSLITAEQNMFQELGLTMHTAISAYFQKQEIYAHPDCAVVAFGDGRIDLDSGKSMHADL